MWSQTCSMQKRRTYSRRIWLSPNAWASFLIILGFVLVLSPSPSCGVFLVRLFQRRNQNVANAAPLPQPIQEPMPPQHPAGNLQPAAKGDSRNKSGKPSHYNAAGLWHLPHLPQWWDSIPEPILRFWAKLKSILLYKPPVGATAVYVAGRLIALRRRRSQSMVGALEDASKPRQRYGRKLDLDTSDRVYDTRGGVESVRVELLKTALKGVARNMEEMSGAPSREKGEALAAALEALSFSCPPRGSREAFVTSTSEPLGRLSPLCRSPPPKSRLDGKTNDELMLWQAAKVAEMRSLDATLRILRDHLVISARLVNKEMRLQSRRLGSYEQWGILQKRLYRLYRRIRRSNLQRDRTRFAVAEAAFRSEVGWLGAVQQLLLIRPEELPMTKLLAVVEGEVDWISTSGGEVGGIGGIQSSNAEAILTEEDTWNDAADMWTKTARRLVYDVVAEKMSLFGTNLDKRNATLTEHLDLLSEWSKENGRPDGVGWRAVLSLVDRMSTSDSRRIKGRNAVVEFLMTSDYYGVPSSVTILALSRVVHNILSPRWSTIVRVGKEVFEAVKGVFIFRFWRPIKDIVLDLLNKRPHLLDPYALLDAQTSLDNMLKDLGFGDGTPANRNDALAEASRMYEEQLRSGALKNMFRGKIVRLMLIQIQQLKAGLLQAMGSIDELVDANRLNVQLLAAIPAFLLVYVGWRVFAASLYSLRSRDIWKSTKVVHSEMTDYLSEMERTLLLAGHAQDATGAIEEPPANATQTMPSVDDLRPPYSVLQGAHLGEFVLLLHSYLLLLDFCCPPFAYRACDAIHRGLQDLLMPGQLSTSQQISLLKLIEAKHLQLENALRFGSAI